MRSRGLGRPTFLGAFAQPARRIFSHLTELVDRKGPSLADFRAELATLGLLGVRFTPEAYAAALGNRLEIEITIAEYPDAQSTLMGSEAAREGNLAEIAYNADRNEAVVLVRESLKRYPWPSYELQVYHELSHLAAGHPLRVAKRGRASEIFQSLGTRLARRVPGGGAVEGGMLSSQEEEASKRAKWLVLAGASPDVFAGDDTDRLT